jgi:hypothetical protein
VSDCDEIVNDLLGAMLAVWQRLTVKKQEFSTADAHMSEIVIHVGPFSQGDTPFFGLDAYLDATFQSGASGVRQAPRRATRFGNCQHRPRLHSASSVRRH